MEKFTPELISKARKAGSTDELIAIAKENGIEMSAKAATELMKKLKPADGAIAEDELESVAGGGCNGSGGSECETLFKDGCPKFFLDLGK